MVPLTVRGSLVRSGVARMLDVASWEVIVNEIEWMKSVAGFQSDFNDITTEMLRAAFDEWCNSERHRGAVEDRTRDDPRPARSRPHTRFSLFFEQIARQGAPCDFDRILAGIVQEMQPSQSAHAVPWVHDLSTAAKRSLWRGRMPAEQEISSLAAATGVPRAQIREFLVEAWVSRIESLYPEYAGSRALPTLGGPFYLGIGLPGGPRLADTAVIHTPYSLPYIVTRPNFAINFTGNAPACLAGWAFLYRNAVPSFASVAQFDAFHLERPRPPARPVELVGVGMVDSHDLLEQWPPGLQEKDLPLHGSRVGRMTWRIIPGLDHQRLKLALRTAWTSGGGAFRPIGSVAGWSDRLRGGWIYRLNIGAVDSFLSLVLAEGIDQVYGTHSESLGGLDQVGFQRFSELVIEASENGKRLVAYYE